VANAVQLTVAVLYDTSFLMNGGRPVVVQVPAGQLDAKKNRDYIIRTVEITHILPDEVKREIQGHFPDAEKVTATRAARKTVAELIALGDAADEPCRYQEVILAAVAAKHSTGDVLGADSRTDRLLIGYAKQLAESDSFDCVCVATEDGGIMVDVNKLRVQHGLNLYCISAKDGPNITELVVSIAPEAKREYRYSLIDLPGLLWKKLFG